MADIHVLPTPDVEGLIEAVAPRDLRDARDERLVGDIRAGDEEAFRALFRRYAPMALALAKRVVGQSFLAEETVQEAFLAVWRNPDGYRAERGSVRAWLMSTVHHRAVDLVRREEAQRRRTEEAAPDPEPDLATAVLEEIGGPEEQAAVRRALGDLSEEQRSVIELMYFEGLSQSQIAERHDIPLGTVKSRALLGMRRLRAALLHLER